MTVTDADEAEVVRLLARDVEATLGPGHEADVRYYAASKRKFADNPAWQRELADNPAWYWEAVVDEVQQDFHDCFVHTTWPPCPRHHRHPLWLHGQHWTCEQDGVPVARLGELASIRQAR